MLETHQEQRDILSDEEIKDTEVLPIVNGYKNLPKDMIIIHNYIKSALSKKPSTHLKCNSMKKGENPARINKCFKIFPSFPSMIALKIHHFPPSLAEVILTYVLNYAPRQQTNIRLQYMHRLYV